MINKYAFLIGVDQYQHLPPKRQLPFVAEDICQMSDVLKNICGFEIREVLTGHATHYKILSKKLREFFRKAYDPNTLLLLFFSGHGFLSADRRRGYLGCYDTEDDEGLILNALEMRNLREDYLEQKLSSRQLLIILDCCYSGAFLTKGPQTGSGYFLNMLKNENLSEIETSELEPKGASPLPRASGLLAACSELEGAFPTEDKKMSRYTKYFIDALRDEHSDAHQNGIYSATTISCYIHKRFKHPQNEQNPIASGKNYETIILAKKGLEKSTQVSSETQIQCTLEDKSLFSDQKKYRLKRKLERLENGEKQLHDKIGYLQETYINAISGEHKYELKKQIEKHEEELKTLEKQIEALYQQIEGLAKS